MIGHFCVLFVSFTVNILFFNEGDRPLLKAAKAAFGCAIHFILPYKVNITKR